MSTLSAFAGTAGPPLAIEHNGKTFRFNRIDQSIKLAIENHLYERACKALIGLRNAYPLEQYLAELEKLRRRYDDGAFAFESDEGMNFIQKVSGMLFLASKICDCTEMELIDLMSARGPETIHMIKQIFSESFSSLKNATDVKNAASGVAVSKDFRPG